MAKRKLVPLITILLIIMIILSIILFIYCIVLISLFASKLKKRKERDVEDKIIRTFDTFNFIYDPIRPIYSPNNENLGLAGRLYLKCYIGYCLQFKTKYNVEFGLDDDGPTLELHKKGYIYYHIKYNCSLDCFYSKGSLCHSCPSDYEEEGECLINDDDNEYDIEKLCFGDNIIYFWKGKKYQSFQNKVYTYLKDAKLKNESCPENTKNCGILDDEENKLCIPVNYDCPPNIISTTKLNSSKYSTSLIDNKTIYYTYDENAINNKIIAGLYADSDIYINKEEENENNTIILDTYTISGLLKDNYLLLRGINLGYDPYEINDIDKKGKSYLKVRYNTKRPNLISMREQKNQSISDKTMNQEVVGSIGKKYLFMIGAIVFYFYSFICLAVFTDEKSNGYDFHFNLSFKVSFCIFAILLIMSAVSFAITCISISKFNKSKEIDPKKNFNYLGILNLIYIILASLVYFLYLVLLLVLLINRKLMNSFDDNSVTKTSNNIDKTDANNNISLSKENQNANQSKVTNNTCSGNDIK